MFELRELKDGGQGSGYAKEFSHSMREVHEIVRKDLTRDNEKLKHMVDDRKREVQFKLGDLVMVHLQKERLEKGVPHKL